MGRPINKHFLGESQIHGFAKVGSAAPVDAYLVKQTGTHEFIVNADGVEATVNLVTKPVADLESNEMVIFANTPNGGIIMVKTFKGHVATLSDGSQEIWSTRTSTPNPLQVSKAGSIIANPAVPVISITSQPVSVTGLTAPATATFSVTAKATNSATLTYQWQKDGVVISGATSSSYTTPATTSGETATFVCIVSATGGAQAVTTEPATLEVD